MIVQAIHPIRHTAHGVALCPWCSQPTSHYTLFVCDERIRYDSCLASERERFDRRFLESCGIAVNDAPARGVVYTELAICRDIVRKRREFLTIRKPVARRKASPDVYDLGEIS
jgi:hypothetical protein